MSIVERPPRLASASVVFFGRHGDVTRHAQQRDVCRQRLYREADSVLRDLDVSPKQTEIDRLRQQIADLEGCLDLLRAEQTCAVVIDADRQAEFASTAQAEGVSLPAARRLLAVLLREQTPSVAQLGRFSRQAGLRAAPLLEVFDAHARPLARQSGSDEIFFGQKPVLMLVEPESLCWLSGRLSPSRDGEEWAKELKQLPALEHLTRDGALGISNGVARVNQERAAEKKEPVGEQLDHFHTLREGGRALRQSQGKAEKAWSKAEEADKKVAKQARQGRDRRGYARDGQSRHHQHHFFHCLPRFVSIAQRYWKSPDPRPHSLGNL